MRDLFIGLLKALAVGGLMGFFVYNYSWDEDFQWLRVLMSIGAFTLFGSYALFLVLTGSRSEPKDCPSETTEDDPRE